MKSCKRVIVMGVLGWAALTAAPTVLAQDTEDCRGGYRVMLMTPAECKAFLKQLNEVRARGDRLAELDLKHWHADLLIQRAQACPCRAGEHFVLYQRTSGAQQPRKSQFY